MASTLLKIKYKLLELAYLFLAHLLILSPPYYHTPVTPA